MKENGEAMLSLVKSDRRYVSVVPLLLAVTVLVVADPACGEVLRPASYHVARADTDQHYPAVPED